MSGKALAAGRDSLASVKRAVLRLAPREIGDYASLTGNRHLAANSEEREVPEGVVA